MAEHRELRDRLSAFSDRADEHFKRLSALRKACKQLLSNKGPFEPGLLADQLAAFEKAPLDGGQLEAERTDLLDAMAARLERTRKALRMSAVGALYRAAASAGLELRKVAEVPPTFFLAPVVVELDFEASSARILYAREVVTNTPLDPAAVLAGRREVMASIRQGALDSPDFFDMLRRAYELVGQVRQVRPGGRVDLVDLMVPLAMLRAGVAKWRTLGDRKISPIPRHLLAYQLQRLRKDGLLEKDGVRLDLGVATGATTKKKRDVLFLPSPDGEGQYYLSIRFIKSIREVES